MSRLSDWIRLIIAAWGRKDKPEPAPVPVPTPEPEPEDPPSNPQSDWAVVPVPQDWRADWRIELVGDFRRVTAGKRLMRSDWQTLRNGLDMFMWGDGRMRLRLYHQRIRFTRCIIGDGKRIGESSDHYAISEPILKELRKGTHTLTLDYLRSQSEVRLALDGSVVLAFAFEVLSEPPRRSDLWLTRFSGQVRAWQIGGPLIWAGRV